MGAKKNKKIGHKFIISLSMQEFVVIATFPNVHDTAGAIAILDEEGIHSELKDEFNSSNMKPFDFVGSTVKLQVKNEDAAAAISILIREGYLSEKDLGPDKAMAWLAGILKKPFFQRAIQLTESFLFWVVAIGVILILLVIFMNTGGGKW